jgi:hypothetical protein
MVASATKPSIVAVIVTEPVSSTLYEPVLDDMEIRAGLLVAYRTTDVEKRRKMGVYETVARPESPTAISRAVGAVNLSRVLVFHAPAATLVS